MFCPGDWGGDYREFRRVVRLECVLDILNPMHEPVQVQIEPGYRRLTGDQAPRHEYIVDDSDAAFVYTGNWTAVTYDSGGHNPNPPFYHNWGATCCESSGDPGDEARWNLAIPAADTYTITAWWPAAPSSETWSSDVLYEVVAQGEVVASVTFDQRTGGDEWHWVADSALAPEDTPFVRVTSQDSAPCVADALHVRSAARYNDGSPALTLELRPMDGIILERIAGDIDGDGDVDLDDFQILISCLDGPDVPAQLGCEPADVDRDDDVDLADFAAFQVAF